MSIERIGLGKRIVFWVVTVVLLLIIVNLGKGTLELMSAGERADKVEKRVEELADEKAKLEEELEWRQSDAFVEQEIRNELKMARPDDVVVMVDEALYEQMVEEVEMEVEVVELVPNWRKWLLLFM